MVGSPVVFVYLNRWLSPGSFPDCEVLGKVSIIQAGIVVCGLQDTNVSLSVGHILIYGHLGIANAEDLWIVGLIEDLFDDDVQLLIQGMGILDLMMHAGAGAVVLYPGLLLEQGAVVQGICCIISCSNCNPHGRIDHGDILFELNAVLIIIIVVCVGIVGKAVHIL